MTTSFAEQVRAAVASAENTPKTETAQRYRAILDELALGLEGLGVGACIRQGRDHRKLTIYVYPRHQPARVHLVLTFFLDGNDIVVSGEKTTTFNSVEGLQSWLLTYVGLPAFVESLDILRDAAKLPVEARLRVDAREEYASGDVLVSVTPDSQEILDKTSMGHDVELVVERLEFPGNRHFGEPPRYAVLESAGLFITIDEATLEGDKLRLKGKRAASSP